MLQRLGYFPAADQVPEVVIGHVRRCLGLSEATAPEAGQRTAAWQRELVRGRVGAVFDPERARTLAAGAIRAAAEVKNHPPDLINVALEVVVKESLELPGFWTLDRMASEIRVEVNTALFERIAGRMAQLQARRINALLEVAGRSRKSAYDRLKQAAGRASWSGFREQVQHLAWVDSLGDTGRWLEGIAESKMADFAGEAQAADAAVMREMAQPKRTALLACMVHVAQTRARDELAEMFCKRVALIIKRAKAELDQIRVEGRAISERLIEHYREVLRQLDPRGPAISAERVLELAREAIAHAGGFEAELADIESVAAHHAENYMPLVARQMRRDRATMFAFAHTVQLEATSADRSVLDALEHVLAHQHLTRDLIPDHADGVPLDLSFCSEQWQRLIRPRQHSGRLDRRHFEACVFTYLARELRTGDVAVRGSEAYANWAAKLLGWEQCQPLLGEFCAEAGLPASANEFVATVRATLTAKAEEVDAGYPANADLVIDQQTGVPSLKRRKGTDRSQSAIALEEQIKERMPERSLLEILARTAYWIEWWRRFGPPSGSDPKLAKPLLRYVLTTFSYGSLLGPAQAARHIRGVSAHEFGATANRHFTIEKLDRAIADVINAYLKLDLAKVWGDATSVAADGTQIDTLIDNLLAERHIRYGGYGGIAYHHVADNYIALFSHFIPCGVWEAVYIIEGLLKQRSDADPDTIHADTQGQSYPVHALAHLFGFELLTRIRNWTELTFYRPHTDARYAHIDSLFGEPGQNAIDWRLIETHWRDLMRVVLSIREGRLSSTLLLRRLGSESRKNNVYKAFRELGRAIRTITLLRYISEPELREQITAATNKAESYNAFSGWLAFGSEVIERNDPAEQEKMIKFNSLLANCAIFHTTLDMTAVIRQLIAEGWTVDLDDLASTSPYITERIKRFGEYPTEGLTEPPEAFDPHLELLAATAQAA